MRKVTNLVRVGKVEIGGGKPVVIQSMTNTDTADVNKTVKQIIELVNAGSEIVRLTVNNDEAALAVPKIKEALEAKNIDVPLVGCFHYNGHTLLTKYKDLCEALDKYRINPGNVGFGEKRDKQFEIMIEKAIEYNKPVRIGVNWGSLDQDLQLKLMDENAKASNPKSATEILYDALVLSSLYSAKAAEEIGLGADKIIVSCKVSKVQDLIHVYRRLSKESNYALHLGLTEAGMGMKGIVATSVALGILLQEGIGDTIRASLTPIPGSLRSDEVRLCKEVLQSLGFRNFTPEVTSCPGCGRTSSTYFMELTENIQNFIEESMPIWKTKYKGIEDLKIAVMGCIVNGPGESKHANIGISLPGSGESPSAPVFIDGEKKYTLRGDIATDFKKILVEYIENKYITL